MLSHLFLVLALFFHDGAPLVNLVLRFELLAQLTHIFMRNQVLDAVVLPDGKALTDLFLCVAVESSQVLISTLPQAIDSRYVTLL